MKLKSLILGSAAALGLSAGVATTAQAADLEEIAAFALDICDAVNATGITISSADHCMKFSGEFTVEKNFYWYDGDWWYSEGFAELELLIEVMGDSDFGVTRGWIELLYHGNNGTYMEINEIGVSIGNTTVLAAGYGATIFNDDEDETLNHLLAIELGDVGPEIDDDETGGVYVSVTHDLGNGWSVAKAIECIDSCEGNEGLGFVGVVAYDNEGITGHVTVLFSQFDGFETVHAGIEAEFDSFTLQAAWFYNAWGYWEANASILATLDVVELAAGFYINDFSEWAAIFSLQFDAGDFTIAKAFSIWDDGYWEFEAELSTDLSDTLTLTADFWIDADSDWEVGKELAWAPGGGYEASSRAFFGDDGSSYFGVESEVTLEF